MEITEKKVIIAHFKIVLNIYGYLLRKTTADSYEIIFAVEWACLTRCGMVLTRVRGEGGLVLVEATNCSTTAYGLKTSSNSCSV
jgi:hypothetical protein